jgi:hypothetical protein
MEFDIVIKQAVNKPNPKNQYHLTVEFMHGDGDGQTKKTMVFPVGPNAERLSRVPTIDQVLTYLTVFFALEWNDGCDFCMKKSFKLETLAKAGLGAETVSAIEEFGCYDGDITCDHQFGARPDAVELVYFNEFGIKHTTELFFKGTSDKPKMTRN